MDANRGNFFFFYMYKTMDRTKTEEINQILALAGNFSIIMGIIFFLRWHP